jgi:ribulose 1,5-bisphosphate synthetase/thiazole synthase
MIRDSECSAITHPQHNHQARRKSYFIVYDHTTMVEVAVIGAGAAGLVASRHLLGCGLRPFIFDTAKTVGGERRSNKT